MEGRGGELIKRKREKQSWWVENGGGVMKRGKVSGEEEGRNGGRGGVELKAKEGKGEKEKVLSGRWRGGELIRRKRGKERQCWVKAR